MNNNPGRLIENFKCSFIDYLNHTNASTIQQLMLYRQLPVLLTLAKLTHFDSPSLSKRGTGMISKISLASKQCQKHRAPALHLLS
jgi:hypothetical protein